MRCLPKDPWWNPAVEEQAVMRIHRIGQTKTVSIRRFIVKVSFFCIKSHHNPDFAGAIIRRIYEADPSTFWCPDSLVFFFLYWSWYNMAVQGTVEERMEAVQARKQRMISGALTDQEVRTARIEELKMLFSWDYKRAVVHRMVGNSAWLKQDGW